jgi:hypothetical protein
MNNEDKQLDILLWFELFDTENSEKIKEFVKYLYCLKLRLKNVKDYIGEGAYGL